MTRLATLAHDVQDRAADWLNDPSSQVDAVVHSVLSRIDDAQVPQVVSGLVGGLTGNKKASERARRAAARALQQAERRTKRTHQGQRGTWLVVGILSVALVGGVLVWRSLQAREPAGSRNIPDAALPPQSREGTIMTEQPTPRDKKKDNPAAPAGSADHSRGQYPEGDYGSAGQVGEKPDDAAEGSYADVEPEDKDPDSR